MNPQAYDSTIRRQCAICGQNLDGFGNNAEPVTEGRCCDACNRQRVIPARMLDILGWSQSAF